MAKKINMRNFKEETLNILNIFQYKSEDVEYVAMTLEEDDGDCITYTNYKVAFSDFIKNCDFDYNPCDENSTINYETKIVMKNGNYFHRVCDEVSGDFWTIKEVFNPTDTTNNDEIIKKMMFMPVYDD